MILKRHFICVNPCHPRYLRSFKTAPCVFVSSCSQKNISTFDISENLI